MGPTNTFEEHIEWTQKGKQWPYPIDNEFKLGMEENVSEVNYCVIQFLLFLYHSIDFPLQVSFVEHIFLERHVQALGIPKTGPVAHFMHLVRVSSVL